MEGRQSDNVFVFLMELYIIIILYYINFKNILIQIAINKENRNNMKKQNLGQKTYLIVQNPFASIENYKNSRTFEKFKNTKVKSIVFQEQFKNRWNSRTIQGIQRIQGRVAILFKHLSFQKLFRGVRYTARLVSFFTNYGVRFIARLRHFRRVWRRVRAIARLVCRTLLL